MPRADMDALPIVVATGPDGNDEPVMRACGHDMRVAGPAGAAALLGRAKDACSTASRSPT